MNLTFSPQVWEDYTYWQATDAKIVARINQLLKEIIRSSHTGIGKPEPPEPLKHALKGYWSRRIDAEHRIVYQAQGETILIAQLRFHYS